MNKQSILNHLNTKIPYNMLNPKKRYIISEWYKFSKENLPVIQEIQKENDDFEIELNVSKLLLRLKKFLPEKNFVKCK